MPVGARVVSFAAAMALLLVGAAELGAQQLQFDVASVKPASADLLQSTGFQCGFGGGGAFRAVGTLQWLVACAYGIEPARASQQIVGRLPGWFAVDLFLIAARAPAGAAPRTQAEGLPMLQALLAARFQLRAHRETRRLPAYDLIVKRTDGRLGPKLRAASSDCAEWLASGRRGSIPRSAGNLPCGRGAVAAGSIRDTAMTMERLATTLSARVGRPVVNRTGLTGAYDLDLRWIPEGRGGTPSESLPSSIFTALDEQLGLHLTSSSADVRVLVVEAVERPTPD